MSCHDMLMQIHDPSATKCEMAHRLVVAKQMLDVELGLAPGPDGEKAIFGVAPYGGNNIVGTHIHEKTKDGVNTGQMCITVLVNQKPPKGSPCFDMIPEAVNGIPTDIVALGEGVKQAGVVGITLSDIGTITALVHCGGTEKYILSNQHVLNPNATMSVGQPVYNDQAVPIGQLRAWTLPNDAELDAAIALISNPTAIGPLYDFTLNPSPMTDAEVAQEMQAPGGFLVKKFGNRSGPTMGTLSGPRNVPGPPSQQQWVILGASGLFSQIGDSGSLIVGANNNRPVGLLWGADNNMPSVSYANRISVVKKRFRISSFQ
ncbi:MAG: hypothetical protein JSS49_10205 [Planctomycetes bacterium]|nr:hypothetical protein [Planctomycetota bacterium]